MTGTRPRCWRYRIGRLLQLLGLLILPFAIASELMDKVGLGQSLLIAGGGAAVFYVGVQLQHRESKTRSGMRAPRLLGRT